MYQKLFVTLLFVSFFLSFSFQGNAILGQCYLKKFYYEDKLFFSLKCHRQNDYAPQDQKCGVIISLIHSCVEKDFGPMRFHCGHVNQLQTVENNQTTDKEPCCHAQLLYLQSVMADQDKNQVNMNKIQVICSSLVFGMAGTRCNMLFLSLSY